MRRWNCRYKFLPIYIEDIISICFEPSEANIIRRLKLPDDTHAITAHYDVHRRQFLILLESKEFDVVKIGETIPEIDPSSVFVQGGQIKWDTNEEFTLYKSRIVEGMTH